MTRGTAKFGTRGARIRVPRSGFGISFLRRLRLLRAAAPWLSPLFVGASAAAQTVALPPQIVTATRSPGSPRPVPVTVETLSRDELDSLPAETLDDALRTYPEFSLFRRSDSLTANPTSQGVSLRGLGPSGASRSLVLLDGVPLNDPFGGWIDWSMIPADSVGKIEVVPGGGATAWGDAALGGVIQLFSIPPVAPPVPAGRGSSSHSGGASDLAIMLGQFATRRESLEDVQSFGRGAVRLSGEDFRTDGFAITAPESRGPVDVPAWSRHRTFAVRFREPAGSAAALTATARSFDEQRGNGTPYQRNGTRIQFASLDVDAQPTDRFVWRAVAYAQEQSYSSTFSAVNATRTSETPADDQYAVPAAALGVSWTGTWMGRNGARTGIGADLRTVHGETREHYLFSDGRFTRSRVAGGSQDFAGLFAILDDPVSAALTLTAGARADEWVEANGHRREADLTTGAILRDDRYSSSRGAELSPSAGFAWNPAPRLAVRANAQGSFRRPTLNELYRPFRQGSNVVEANPFLRTERAATIELGLDWAAVGSAAADSDRTSGATLDRRSPFVPSLAFGADAFWNGLNDAVANVTVARGPGTYPLFGYLPAGVVGRRRLNLDRTDVRGIALSLRWAPLSALAVTCSYLRDDAVVRSAAAAPGLAGKRLPEVARNSAVLTAAWSTPGWPALTARIRWIGPQYDDDENAVRLPEVTVADIRATRRIGRGLELFAGIENLANARVETARSPAGVVSTGTPRLVSGGLRARW